MNDWNYISFFFLCSRLFFVSLMISNLKVGSVHKGTVKRVEDFGVFVSFGGSLNDVTGLCHISEAADMSVLTITHTPML